MDKSYGPHYFQIMCTRKHIALSVFFRKHFKILFKKLEKGQQCKTPKLEDTNSQQTYETDAQYHLSLAKCKSKYHLTPIRKVIIERNRK